VGRFQEEEQFYKYENLEKTIADASWVQMFHDLKGKRDL
jgi:hypothetical protein